MIEVRRHAAKVQLRVYWNTYAKGDQFEEAQCMVYTVRLFGIMIFKRITRTNP